MRLSSFKWWLSVLMELGKFRITFSVTITTAAGYYLADAPHLSNPIWPVLGILFIGLSSAALNQWQDRAFDAKMDRTKHRPIPTGKVTGVEVFWIVLVFFCFGTELLWLKTNPLATLLGVSAFVWYNGIYTYLKRVSTIAVIPGALIGGLPPALGYTAAGGAITDPLIVTVTLFLIIWQIPHFWLLLFLYGDDYRKAGFPVIQDRISARMLGFYTFVGVLLMVAIGVAIPFSGEMESIWTVGVILLSGLFILYKSLYLITDIDHPAYKRTFILINIYTVCVLVFVVLIKVAIVYSASSISFSSAV